MIFRCQRCGKHITFEQIACQVPICLCGQCSAQFFTMVRKFERYSSPIVKK